MVMKFANTKMGIIIYNKSGHFLRQISGYRNSERIFLQVPRIVGKSVSNQPTNNRDKLLWLKTLPLISITFFKE
uniref:Uncharacterized protein n=1 Tax=Megaselia scalaris TaxID=36166 RepID=T1H186_MEGSC